MNKLINLFLTMFKIGLFTFGGGYAMISILQDEFVERKKWIESDEFMNLVTIAESTPGPIASKWFIRLYSCHNRNGHSITNYNLYHFFIL